MDLLSYTLQVAFFYMDFDLVSKSIDKAKKLFEEGGDWERKNRLKVYEGLYCMSTRNFKKAASLFLDSISTFTTYEIFPYETFIFYTVLTSIITLDTVSLMQKVVDAPEIFLTLLELRCWCTLSFWCFYSHSRFISAGKLHCKIDKVAGVLETNHPDANNALYQATIKQGDFLLNRTQKLSPVIISLSTSVHAYESRLTSKCFDMKGIKVLEGLEQKTMASGACLRAGPIYEQKDLLGTSMARPVFQLRVSFVKDVKKQEEMWETQHELAAHKVYNMCSDLGGFFLKVAQILGKPDLAPAAWVHRARVKGDKRDVVVKVQHPGVEKLMMTDIRNLQIFALYIQKTDIKFDLFSITKEMEKQIGYEFDFKREANAMEKIRRFLYDNNRKSHVLVPRVLPHLVTRRVLVMDYINGIPILRLGDEMAKRGINPRGKMAEAAKLNILSSSEVALLDYGQVKELPDQLRLGYANLVIAIADNNASLASQSFRELGIVTFAKCENEEPELLQLAKTMFDTKMPPGVTVLQPFSEDSSIKKISVEGFPEELFSVLRTVILLRGLSVGIGLNYSCAQQWKPIAEEALISAGRLSPGRKQKRRFSSLRRLYSRD
ncbi:Uncharacterized protein Rs2_45066 [Raphanus sativus]|nr:Uncharacterized protein Rs2_45066 [Raphanus sativus]